MCKSFIIIGISDAEEIHLTEEVLRVVEQYHLFSGGKRHHQLVSHLLPSDAIWIDITVPLQKVFDQYQSLSDTIVVFASGDPLFFGFANTIQRVFPTAEIKVYPTFHSLQLLAHRMVIPYHDMHHVSLTGRSWHAFDAALIQGYPMIGVLTDGVHTPAAIAQRMIDYGYLGYQMTVGEHLGNEHEERVTTGSLQEIAAQSFAKPNCVILRAEEHNSKRMIPMGIPDTDFELLDGREKMITKAPIRLLTIAALELHDKQSFWDIGFCTGSVSIEALRLFPKLHITAFEVREEGCSLMDKNSKRFGAPGIKTVIGDFLTEDIDQLLTEPDVFPPDAIFIGGHGGQLKEMIEKAVSYLSPGGVVVYNCVLPESITDERIRKDSRQIFEDTAIRLGMELCTPQCVTINDYHPIQILKCKKP